MVAAASSAGMGAPFSVLKGVGKLAAGDLPQRAQRSTEGRKRERRMAGVGRVTGGIL
jgi:hypothetical protein